MKKILLLSCLIPIFLAFAVAQAETFNVPCSADALIGAIHTANATSGTHTLVLSRGCTYTLTATDNADATGDNGLPKITGHLTINGQAAILERQAAADFRFFQAENTAVLIISDLTLKNGRNAADNKIDGGAIFNNGATLNISGCTFNGNYAGCGGAIYSPSGALNITNSTFSGNEGFS